MLNAAHQRLVVPTAIFQMQPIFLQILKEFARPERPGVRPSGWHVRCYVLGANMEHGFDARYQAHDV